MTIEECYKTMGGSYEDVCTRLPSLSLIEKFIGKFLEDKSFETLRMKIECGDRKGAFSASHTLKGICANLGFTKLLESVARLTEELRSEDSSISDKAVSLFKDVERDYEVTADAICGYLNKQ